MFLASVAPGADPLKLVRSIATDPRSSIDHRAANMTTDTSSSDQAKVEREKTEFAKRNPFLEKLVPDAIENAVDAMLPDQFEKVRCSCNGRDGTGLATRGPPATAVLLWVTH